MGMRISKVDQEPVTQILGNVTIEALNDFSTRLLVGADHLTKVFWIQLTG